MKQMLVVQLVGVRVHALASTFVRTLKQRLDGWDTDTHIMRTFAVPVVRFASSTVF
jgi:hypothetical protein